MDYKKLGTSDLMVSPVCVGCMSFGERFADFHEWTLNQEETTEVVKHALDLGINFFDTANCYAHGTSEEFLGKAIKSSGVAREKVITAPLIGATKASHYDDAVEALKIKLTAEDVKYLEELYTPHKIVGAL